MKEKKISKKIWIAIIAVFLAIAIAVTSIVLVHKKNSDNANDNNYVMLDSGFTDVKVKDEKAALKAIESVADIVGIGDETMTLEPKSTETIDGKKYYRLWPEWNGIPVFGKSVVLKAEADGTAALLTSNCSTPSISMGRYQDVDIDKDRAVVYDNNICYIDCVQKGYENYLQFKDVKSGKVVSEQCVSYAADYVERENGRLVLFDKARNIKALNANKELLKMGFDKERKNLTFTLYSGNETDTRRDVETGTLYLGGEKYRSNVVINNNIQFYTAGRTAGLDKNAVLLMKQIQTTNDYWKDVFGRKGFDNHQSRMYVVVNDKIDDDDPGNNSASVLGALLKFGYNADFNKIDLIAHEYAHSVQESIVISNYEGESGAICEAFADVFGELVEAYANDSDPDWIHKNFGSARNMISPKSNNKPDTFEGENWKSTTAEYDKNDNPTNDMGHVHNNSTVMSHAAYLMWHGIDGDSEKALDRNKLAKLWFEAMCLTQEDVSFSQFAAALEKTADQTKELSDKQKQCVHEALEKVGIKSSGSVAYRLATNGTKVSVLDVDQKELDTYYLSISGGAKSRDRDGKAILSEEYTSKKPYVVALEEGTYIFTVKESEEAPESFSYTVRVADSPEQSDERARIKSPKITIDTLKLKTNISRSIQHEEPNYSEVIGQYKKASQSGFLRQYEYVNKNIIGDPMETFSLSADDPDLYYAMEDMNQDGVDELLIGYDAQFENEMDGSRVIHCIDVYTFDGKPIRYVPETVWFDLDGDVGIAENNEIIHYASMQYYPENDGRLGGTIDVYSGTKNKKTASEKHIVADYDDGFICYEIGTNGSKKTISWKDYEAYSDYYLPLLNEQYGQDYDMKYSQSNPSLHAKKINWKLLEERQTIATTSKDNIDEDQAFEIAKEYWNWEEGQVEEGIRTGLFSDGPEYFDGVKWYKFRLSGYVDEHYSTWDIIFVNASTGSVHNAANGTL